MGKTGSGIYCYLTGNIVDHGMHMKLKNNYQNIIRKIADQVRKELRGIEAGHDWWHVYRVWQNARLIARTEKVDWEVVELAALLHDIADPKFYNGDEEAGPIKARKILVRFDVEEQKIDHIIEIIRSISFRNSFEDSKFHSIEKDVVQDADRLDAMGAIGISRAFNFGGYKNREIYDPDRKPVKYLSKDVYKNSDSPTINHFYEKLLLLRDLMNTKTGKKLAKGRHAFMEEFLARFLTEWRGEA